MKSKIILLKLYKVNNFKKYIFLIIFIFTEMLRCVIYIHKSVIYFIIGIDVIIIIFKKPENLCKIIKHTYLTKNITALVIIFQFT